MAAKTINTCLHRTVPAAEGISSAILNAVDEIFVYLDRDMKVVWANEAACRSAHLPLDEIRGKFCHMVWNQRTTACRRCPVKKTLGTGEPEELIVRRANGRDWLLKGYPAHDAHGNIEGLIACMYDVTAHAHAEESLKHSYRFLEIANRHNALNPLLMAFGREIKNMTECEVVRICIQHPEKKRVYDVLMERNAARFQSREPTCTKSGKCQCRWTADESPFAETDEHSNAAGAALADCLDCTHRETIEESGCKVSRDHRTQVYIPIIWAQAPLGVIHLADPKPNKLPKGLLDQLKQTAMQIGAATQRIKAEEGLRKAYITQEERVRERTTQLTRINTQLRREIQEHERAEAALKLNEARIDTLYQLSRMGASSLQQICDFVIEKGVRLTQSQYGYLFFMNEDESVLTVHAWSKAALKICDVEGHPTVYKVAETGLWGEAARQRKPVITNDYAAPNPFKKGIPCGHVPIRRHMNIPVFEGEHIVAIAGVANKIKPYTDADVRQLQLLMDGMWRFIQRKRADEKLRASEAKLRFLTTQLLDAQEKERKRIAIELHDEMGQALLSLKMQVRAIQRRLPDVSAEFNPAFAEVLHNINTVTENVRRLSRDLSPSILEDLGLFAALKWLAEQIVRHHALEVVWDIDDLFEGFSKQQEIQVFRIFQEALTNVAKHSQAQTVTIATSKNNGMLTMTIQDDGKGFDVDRVIGRHAGSGGMGLAAMDERVRILGGTFDLRSEHSDGTCIRIDLPVDMPRRTP